ncbi:MAG: DUF1573 domain-containing protein [bacterium]
MRPGYRAVPFYTLSLFLLLVGLVSVAAASQKSGIETSESAFSFGMIPYGAVVNHTFWLRNISDSTVHISRVNAGCACTTIPIKEKTIAAGDSVPVTIILDTGKIPPKPFRKRSRITTTDSNAETAVFLFTGGCFDPETASLPLKLDPPEVRFSINDGDTLATIEVTNMTETDYRIRLVSASLEPRFSIELPSRQLVPGRTDKIYFRLNPEFGKYPFKESFTFSLTDQGRARITIPVVLQEHEKE